MKKDIYENEIIDNWVRLDDNKKDTDRKYKELSKLLDPMYDFVLAFSNYYNTRRDYGFGPELTMIEVHILTQISDNPSITVTELAKTWHRSTSAISQTVRKLMKQELVYRKNSKTNGKIFHLYTSSIGDKLALAHKKYDNIDILKTRKKLLKEYSVEELVAFDNICASYTKLLRKSEEK
ncbi:MarR family transcriptional regulator [Anaerococcus porci]|uniref:MarR family winged helix-turn-helix transcriptional regulator n=1 Tax=Anaerococcus porci TaxID=2652269 RepID=UPI002A7624A3|nr:MarR family transcriptional regulator [Anaerococcus porci]MDY3005916.1 MarR family transcriptional regulator [Anaerococcus porci]